MWLPTNPITQTIDYNMRFLISDNEINPIAWEVSKREDMHPLGITKITLKQSLYNSTLDNKELMIADYYKSYITPEPTINENTGELIPDIKPELIITYSAKPVVKVGGSYKTFSIDSKNSIDYDPFLIRWEVVDLTTENYTTILNIPNFKIKVNKDYSLIGKVFTLKLYYEDVLTDSVEVEVIAL